MSNLIALAYVSSARELLDKNQLDHILEQSRIFNQQANVSGVLLHHDGNFLQYIEGEPEDIQRVFTRIERSFLHKNIIRLFKLPIEQRFFSEWYMGFAEAPQSTLQQLAQADWHHLLQQVPTDKPLGMKILLDFWQRARRE